MKERLISRSRSRVKYIFFLLSAEPDEILTFLSPPSASFPLPRRTESLPSTDGTSLFNPRVPSPPSIYSTSWPPTNASSDSRPRARPSCISRLFSFSVDMQQQDDREAEERENAFARHLSSNELSLSRVYSRSYPSC